LHLMQLAFGLEAGGDVARYLCETDDLAALVVKSIEHGMSLEAAAVLPEPQPLRFVTPRDAGAVQQPVWHAGRTVFLCEESFEGADDDFIGRVALDPFGTGIPGGDQSIGIEHVDGIVGNAFD